MGGGQLCSVILSFMSFSNFFQNQSLEKADVGGVPDRGAHRGAQYFKCDNTPLGLALLDSLVPGRPLEPPRPGKEPLAPYLGANPADSVV